MLTELGVSGKPFELQDSTGWLAAQNVDKPIPPLSRVVEFLFLKLVQIFFKLTI